MHMHVLEPPVQLLIKKKEPPVKLMLNKKLMT